MLHTGRLRLTLLYLDTGNSTSPISETFSERSKHSETKYSIGHFLSDFPIVGSRSHSCFTFVILKGLNYWYN